MPTLTPEERQQLVDHWMRATTPSGRLRLRLRAWYKQAAWELFTGAAALLKRVIDIIGAFCGLLALSPVLITAALWVKLEDGGPILFKQPRVGIGGRLFPMWKFRSMVPDAEKRKAELMAQNEMTGGVTFKMKNDPRITRPGRILRKYSIDELPQLWNVLVGDMSLVGPRPPVPKEVAAYSVDERHRLLVRPGLTCLWQVGGRSRIGFDGQVRLDVAYIRSESLWLDFKLLLRTIPAVLLGDGAH